jgi:prefoldin subunit 5
VKTIELAREAVASIEARLQQLGQQAQSIAAEMHALTASRDRWKAAIEDDETTASQE